MALTLGKSGAGSLIGQDCDDVSCTFDARRTTDGGRTWTPARTAGDGLSVTAYGPGMVTAPTAADVWAGVPGLFASHDAGASWAAVPGGANVVAFAATRSDVWFVTQRCPYIDICGRSALHRVSVDGSPLPALRSAPTDTHQIVQILRPGGDVAYIVDILGRISFTTDGTHWKTSKTPVLVGAEGNPHGTLSADSPSSLWFSYHPECPAACGGGEHGAGVLYRSTDSGDHWHRMGHVPAESGQSMAAFSGDVAWLKGPSAELARTSDGGRTWQQARNPAADWMAVLSVPLGTQRAIEVQVRLRHGTYGSEEDQSSLQYEVAVTRDGGRTWARLGTVRRTDRPA